MYIGDKGTILISKLALNRAVYPTNDHRIGLCLREK